MRRIFSWHIVKDLFKEFLSNITDENIFSELWYEAVLLPYRRIKERIEGNISFLKLFNSKECYHDWDFDYLYYLINYKLERMEKRLREDNIVLNSDVLADEIKEALHQLEIYYDPELAVGPEPDWLANEHKEISESDNFTEAWQNANNARTEEQEQEMKEYYTKYYEAQQVAWEKFHDILKNKAQGWWD